MKLIILLFAVIAVIAAHDEFKKKTPAEFKAIREACWQELNLSEEQKESMRKYEYADEALIHQAVKCTGLKLNIWCDHEGFHKDDLITQFGETAKPLIEKCLTKKNEDDTSEKWAYNDWKCLADNGLKEYLKKMDA